MKALLAGLVALAALSVAYADTKTPGNGVATGTITPSQIAPGNLPSGVLSSAGNPLVDTAAVQTVTNKLFTSGTVLNTTGSTPTMAGPAPADYSANILSVVDSQNYGASYATVGLSVLDTIGGATQTGNKVAFMASARQTAASTDSGNRVGSWSWAEAAVTPTSGAPNFTGSNPQCRVDSGVTGIASCVGEEADVSIKSTGAAVNLFGVGAVLTSDAAVNASGDSAAFGIWNGSASVAWPIGLEITSFGGHAPITSTGTIFKTTGSDAVGSFIDFSSYTCSGNEINFTNFLVSCAGAIQSNGPIYLNPASGDTVQIQPAGSSGGASLTLNSPASGAGTEYVQFEDNGTLKWFFGNNGGDQWIIWDQAGGRGPITFSTGGAINLNPSAGGLTISNVSTGTNADFLCLSAGGVVLLQSSACTISSRRFKEHIVDLHRDVLARMSALEVASFNMKPNAKPNPDPNFGTRQVGLIAENVAQVFPECAIYENDMKTPKSYRQECVIALLVKGEQELMAQNRTLKARLDQVEKPRQLNASLRWELGSGGSRIFMAEAKPIVLAVLRGQT